MKKLVMIVSLLTACGVANAVLLVHEDFEGMGLGDNPGIASSNECGLGVDNWNNNMGSGGSASVVGSIPFGNYIVGANALDLTRTTSGGSVVFDTGTAGITSGKMYVSFLFSGSAADLAVASFMQFRRTDLNFRVNPLATGSADDGIGVYYDAAYYEDNSGTLMNTGTNYIIIVKFDGLGTAGGTSSGWAVSAEAFDSIRAGGITEAELDAVAYLKASGAETTAGALTMGTSDSFLFTFGGAAEYVIDEIRIATTLADAVGIPLTNGLLVHEDFEGMTQGYSPSASTTWGGSGIDRWSNALGAHATPVVTNSLSFDTYSTGNNALHVDVHTEGGALNFYTSTDGIDTNAMYVSFLFNGSAADLAAAGYMQLRRGDLNFRTSPLTPPSSEDGISVYYGTAYHRDNSDSLMNNGTYLIVAKFDGLGSAAGEATMWAIDSTAFYNNKRDGLTEAELDASAFLKAAGTDSELLTLQDGDMFSMVFGGAAEYTVDEIKIGTSLESVTVPLTTVGPILSSIVDMDFVSDGVVEMVIYSSSPEENVPLVSSDLLTDAWQAVPHSDDGVNDFVLTNLSYSTVSGTNRVIYLQADTAQKFFGIGEQ